MPRLENVVLREGDAIKCKAESSEGKGHAGLIVFEREGGKSEILGKTDAVYETAEDAVAAMELAVKTIRDGQQSEEKPSGTKKTRKKKGAEDGIGDNRQDE